jgi:hypothetical protein
MLASVVGVAQMLGSPLWVGGFALFAWLAPARDLRWRMLFATAIELAVGVCAFAAMWILPLAEQFTATDGNLGMIYRSFRAPLAGPSMREGVAGASAALASSVLPDWSLAWGARVVRTVSVAGLAIAVVPLLAVPWTAELLAAAGNGPATVERIVPSLEDVFIHTVERESQAHAAPGTP